MAPREGTKLQALVRQIAESGAVAVEAVNTIEKQSARLESKLKAAVLAEVPEFVSSRNPDLIPELTQHCRENVDEVLRLLRGSATSNFDFVSRHARRRAEQRFPVEATLHAYRIALRVLSQCLRDAVNAVDGTQNEVRQINSAASDFGMEYVNCISTIFAHSFGEHALLIAEQAGDQRSDLLNILLAGHDEADPRAARLLRDAGFFEERQFFCVALARSVDPTEMLSASRARRMADSIEKVVADSGVRRVIDLHDNKVTMVFAAVSRDSGWTAPRSSLAQQIRAALALVGNAALIGVSNDVPSTAHIPTAHREAATALELATVSERVVQFTDIPLRLLLLHFAAQEFSRVLPEWAGSLQAADHKSNGALTQTLRTYADVDMNILKCGTVLGLHPNTIYARFQRIFDITGLQPTTFNGLTDLLIVSDSIRRGGG